MKLIFALLNDILHSHDLVSFQPKDKRKGYLGSSEKKNNGLEMTHIALKNNNNNTLHLMTVYEELRNI